MPISIDYTALGHIASNVACKWLLGQWLVNDRTIIENCEMAWCAICIENQRTFCHEANTIFQTTGKGHRFKDIRQRLYLACNG
jgi:hypothetical protein